MCEGTWTWQNAITWCTAYSSVCDFIKVSKRAIRLKDLEEHIYLGYFSGSIHRIKKKDVLLKTQPKKFNKGFEDKFKS